MRRQTIATLACGAKVTTWDDDPGPLVEFDWDRVTDAPTFCVSEGDDVVNMTREEVRALLPMLQAFADGAP